MKALLIRCASTIAAALCLCIGLAWSASAQPIADFYRDKTISFIIVFAPGGTYDLYGRLVAAYLPKFIPGNPKIIVQYMPGAGGLNGAVWLTTQAPQDGTALGMVAREIAVNQILHPAGVPLDASKFQWIGSVSSYGGVMYVAGRTRVSTTADLRDTPLVIGSWGNETSSYTIPVLLNGLAGTKFKVVTGYSGAAQVDLAIENGEIDGRIASWSSLKSTKSEALAQRKLFIAMQDGVKRRPDLPEVPLVSELATTKQGRRMLEFIDSDSGIGWSVVAPPKAPPDRVAVLRQAFDRMVADPGFLADAHAKHLEVVPSTGQELEALVKCTVSIPHEDVAAINNLLTEKQ